MTKEQIFTEIKAILIKLFELEEDKISPEATLFEDLELDSIDAVDVIVMLQKKTGKKIAPETFKSVKTVQDVVDAIYNLLHEGA
ncbi:MAG: acyl carrier protein [Succinivibrio sp.]|nr:acyl carrier protein [Succinivibrio sp.]